MIERPVCGCGRFVDHRGMCTWRWATRGGYPKRATKPPTNQRPRGNIDEIRKAYMRAWMDSDAQAITETSAALRAWLKGEA